MIDPIKNQDGIDERTWGSFLQRIAETANSALRSAFFTVDAAEGASIAQSMWPHLTPNTLSQMGQQWSPISPEPGTGMRFQIEVLNSIVLGKEMLSEVFDNAVMSGAIEALMDNHDGVLSELLQDLVTGLGEHYETGDLR